MATTKSSRQSQKEATRELLLEAATTLLAEDGYAALRVAAVAQKAGISLGGMLHHFPTKEAMVLAVIERLSDRVERLMVSASHSDENPEALIMHLAESAEQFYSTPEFLIYLDIFLSLRRRSAMSDTLAKAMTTQRLATEQTWVKRLVNCNVPESKALQIVRCVWGLARGLAISSHPHSKSDFKKVINYTTGLIQHDVTLDVTRRTKPRT